MTGSCVIAKINQLKDLQDKNSELIEKYKQTNPELATHLFNIQAHALCGYREYFEKALNNAEVNIE